MPGATLIVNGTKHQVDIDPEMPLLWVLRDILGLTGAKFGCGMGLCGACTVHVDGAVIRSCSVPLRDVIGKKVVSIEGLVSAQGRALQRAWILEDVSQCGYCQPGQIMAAAALLTDNPQPTTDEINRAMAGNLCRCGTYQRIRRAIEIAARSLQRGNGAPL
jgi:isoquinoline 1-oxidoreductase alpha subunit